MGAAIGKMKMDMRRQFPMFSSSKSFLGYDERKKEEIKTCISCRSLLYIHILYICVFVFLGGWGRFISFHFVNFVESGGSTKSRAHITNTSR